MICFIALGISFISIGCVIKAYSYSKKAIKYTEERATMYVKARTELEELIIRLTIDFS